MEEDKMTVYLLYHSRLVEQGASDPADNIYETKAIGFFDSKEKIEDTIKEYVLLPGFRLFPNDFHIDEYK